MAQPLRFVVVTVLTLTVVASGVTRAAGPEARAQSRQTAVTAQPYYWAWWGWEPLEHNVRVGGPTATVDGSAWWMSKWYDRLHGEPLARQMSVVGVNLAVTHFFKGFGLKHEHAQQQRTAELVRNAHKHGIKVLGYCQFNSLYYETLLAEEPKAADWIKRDETGQLRCWQGKYYRWVPCIHCREYRDYIKRAIRVGLEEVKLDGFNFDNTFAGPCYCDRCEKDFREWLTRRYPNPMELFGIASFDHVRQPPPQKKTDQIDDPLIRAWIRWRCESLAECLGEFAAYARNLNPDVILMANPVHPTTHGKPQSAAVWPVWIGRHLNLMIAENSNSAEMNGDAIISQIRAFKDGTAIGYRAVSTTWAQRPKRGFLEDAAAALPQTAAAVKLQVAEAAANGGVPGANWAMRALGNGDGIRIDLPELSKALGQSLEFARKNEPLMRGAQPVRDVAVLQSFASIAFNAGYAWDHVMTAEEILIRGGFSWEVVFDDDLQRLDGFSVLVLAGQTHLSNATCEAIKRFVDQGGSVVMIGNNGHRDDEGRLPREDRLGQLDAGRVSRVAPGTIHRASDKRYGVCVTLPSKWQQAADAVQKAGGNRLSARVRGSDTVALSAYQGENGRLIVHLVNYATPKATPSLAVELGKAWNKARTARLLDLDTGEKTLPVRATETGAAVEVPSLDVYGVLVVE